MIDDMVAYSTDGVHWFFEDGSMVTDVVVNQELIIEFIASRRSGLSPRSIESYIDTFKRFVGCKPSDFNKRLNALGLGNSKLHHWRNLSVFCNWLVDCRKLTRKPRLPKPYIEDKIQPVVTHEQLSVLLDSCICDRDKAILLLLFESGLRLSEALRIEKKDIDFEHKRVRVVIKGNRQAFAVFQTDTYLKDWFSHHNTFELGKSGLHSIVRRLVASTGIGFSIHALRRGFAVELTRQGIPGRIVQELGHWQDYKMLQHYTKGLSFEQAEKVYRSNT